MDHMKPEKTNVILLTKKDSHLCTEEENWYGTKYCVTGKKCSGRSMNIWISALQNDINQVLHVFYLDWFFSLVGIWLKMYTVSSGKHHTNLKDSVF